MPDQYITLRIDSDIDLSDSRLWTALERIVKGYKQDEIDLSTLLEVTVIEHKTREGWVTEA